MADLVIEHRLDAAMDLNHEKVVRHDAENARVSIRSVRRDALADLKEMQKEKIISQDDERKGQEEIQKLTDRFVAEIDQQLAAKEKEILQV